MERERRGDDDVQALKTLLHQERKKSSSGGISNCVTSQRDVSPIRPSSPAKPIPADRFSRAASSSITKPPPPTQGSECTEGTERSPRRNIALSDASQRGKSERCTCSMSPWTRSAASGGSKTDRSCRGTSLLLDKIITCPNTLDDSDDFDALGDEQQRGEEERSASPAHGSPTSKPGELYSDSKQPPKTTGGVAAKLDASEPLQAARARMEQQMSAAAAQVLAAQQEQQEQDQHEERQHVADQQSPGAAARQDLPPATERHND